MHSEDILQAQRHLRGKLLDDPRALPNLPARDLAAQLLLYLDDPAQCWRISAQWLRNVLDADRVDDTTRGVLRKRRDVSPEQGACPNRPGCSPQTRETLQLPHLAGTTRRSSPLIARNT